MKIRRDQLRPLNDAEAWALARLLFLVMALRTRALAEAEARVDNWELTGVGKVPPRRHP
jgi:hypothetical protein